LIDAAVRSAAAPRRRPHKPRRAAARAIALKHRIA